MSNSIKFIRPFPANFKKYTTDDYLDIVLQIVKYLRHTEVVTDQGKYWKQAPEPGNDYDSDLILNRTSIYGGSAGIGLFWLQLYEATNDEQYLKEAEDTAAYILNTYEGSGFFKRVLESAAGGVWPVAGWGTSVYAGPAGGAIFIYELYEKTGKEEYKNFLITTADDAIAAAIEDENGLHWSDEADLMSDASYVFFFLYAYRKTGDKKYLEASEKVLAYTDTRIVHAKEGGIYYLNLDLRKVGWESDQTIFPNYSHGAAGTAYLNVLLYEETGDKKYLEKAEQVVEFLEAIAEGDEDGVLIPYLYNPDRGTFKEFYYLATCHGPVGTTVLFRKLYDVTKDEKYLKWVDALTRGILKAKAPLIHTPGYWNSYCLCCGAPGVLTHFVKTGEVLKNEKYIEEARITADKLIGDSWNDEDGRRWYAAWTRKMPGFVETYTGLYSGDAGVGTSLLYLYAHDKGIKLTDTFEYMFLK